MRDITGERARMWGPSIVGFGYYTSIYDSGREVENMLVGFSPRKAHLVLYIGLALDDEGLLKHLGKCKRSKACLYINKLADVNEEILVQLIETAVTRTREKNAAK